jgi:hypothetical protein
MRISYPDFEMFDAPVTFQRLPWPTNYDIKMRARNTTNAIHSLSAEREGGSQKDLKHVMEVLTETRGRKGGVSKHAMSEVVNDI